jgi:hypothetical protein
VVEGETGTEECPGKLKQSFSILWGLYHTLATSQFVSFQLLQFLLTTDTVLIYTSFMQWQFLGRCFVKLQVVCIICAVTVSNLNYSYFFFLFGHIHSGSFFRFVCLSRFLLVFLVRYSLLSM